MSPALAAASTPLLHHAPEPEYVVGGRATRGAELQARVRRLLGDDM